MAKNTEAAPAAPKSEEGSVSSRALATIAPGASIADWGIEGLASLEAVSQITRTVLQQTDKSPFAVLFEGPIMKAPEIPGTKKADKETPHIAHVLNLATGEKQVLICNSVLRREIEAAFPNCGYIGKAFAMRSVLGKSKGGNALRLYDIVLVKAPGQYADIVRQVEAAKEGLIADWRAEQEAQRASAAPAA